MGEVRRGGRPRSDQAHHAVLEATRTLLAAKGYENLTIEAIAAEAKVGRQTVYRWWTSKAAVVTEAVAAGFIDPQAAGPPDTGDVLADMRTWWGEYLEVVTDPNVAPLMRGLTVAAAEDAADAERLHTQIVMPIQSALVGRMRTAVEAGQLRADADLETIAETLLGNALYRLVTRRPTRSGTVLVDLLLHGVLVETP